MDGEIDWSLLQEEANRVGADVLAPMASELADEFDLDDEQLQRLIVAMTRSLLQGVRLASVELVAQLQKHGVTIILDAKLVDPEDPSDP